MILKPKHIKVLEKIYAGTDCCNKVWDWAMLHYKQEIIAAEMPEYVVAIEGCVRVDGNGCTIEPERSGKGYRLTNKGYEALTATYPDMYPWDAKYRRFYNANEVSK